MFINICKSSSKFCTYTPDVHKDKLIYFDIYIYLLFLHYTVNLYATIQNVFIYSDCIQSLIKISYIEKLKKDQNEFP